MDFPIGFARWIFLLDFLVRLNLLTLVISDERELRVDIVPRTGREFHTLRDLLGPSSVATHLLVRKLGTSRLLGGNRRNLVVPVYLSFSGSSPVGQSV